MFLGADWARELTSQLLNSAGYIRMDRSPVQLADLNAHTGGGGLCAYKPPYIAVDVDAPASHWMGQV